MQICNFSLQFKPILHFVLSLQIIEWHLHVAKIKLIGTDPPYLRYGGPWPLSIFDSSNTKLQDMALATLSHPLKINERNYPRPGPLQTMMAIIYVLVHVVGSREKYIVVMVMVMITGDLRFVFGN